MESMKQTRISRGVGVQTEKPSMGGVWIFVEQDNLVRNLAFGFTKLVISGKDYKNSLTVTQDLVKFYKNLVCEHRWVSDFCFAEKCGA